MNVDFSIVMPGRNGEDFMVRGISSLLVSARSAGKPFEFIVVDDAGTDTSPRIIRETFPDIRLIANRRKRGFAYSANRGIRAARAPVVILVDNDLVVKEDFVRFLLDPFQGKEADRLFGVSAKTLNWTDGSPNHLNPAARFRRGLIELDYGDSHELCPALFLHGGACALRRDLFLHLGAFRPLYKPGHWEDYDLSFRAAKMGYRILYEPRALAYRLGKDSLMMALGRESVDSLYWRNYFFFTWLNLTDTSLLLRHFLNLPIHLVKEMISGKPLRLTKGFIRAAPHFFRILRSRRKNETTES